MILVIENNRFQTITITLSFQTYTISIDTSIDYTLDNMAYFSNKLSYGAELDVFLNVLTIPFKLAQYNFASFYL